MDATVGEGSSKQNDTLRNQIIERGDNILLKLPSGEIRQHKLDKPDSTVNLGKFGSFTAGDLIGQPYGLTYDTSEKSLKVLPPRVLQEVEDTDATNELIVDHGRTVQPLTTEEIEALKKAGISATEIINRQIEQHANFELKTEYSKEKYRKRKEAKYSKSFTTIIPTLFNVCEYWFNKDHDRLRDIRSDTLSQMMNLGSVRPGGRYIVVDDASGILVAAVLDRMGGSGRLYTICDVESPPAYPVLTHMNFKKEYLNSVMVSLNWATADEEHTPVLASSEPPNGSYKSDGQRSRLNKRKVLNNILLQNREELFAGEFDGLLVASKYDPFSILEKLSPYLAGSASIVVHSPNVQVVADLQAKLRDLPYYLAPAISEPFLRRYQILPMRTHPIMNASGSGGFLLQTYKVYDDPSASAVTAHRRKKHRTGETVGRDAPSVTKDASTSLVQTASSAMQVDSENGRQCLAESSQRSNSSTPGPLS